MNSGQPGEGQEAEARATGTEAMATHLKLLIAEPLPQSFCAQQAALTVAVRKAPDT